MLFLAVFAGFLAENQREHYVEDHRAKVLAKNLYNELLADSILIHQAMEYRKVKENESTYFINYVKDSNLANLSSHFYPAFTNALIQIQYIIFEPNDGILTQLRNSGELRYFKSNELQSEIGRLSVKISHLRTRNEREYSYVEFYNRPFLLKHFDFDWYEDFTNNGTITLIEALKQKSLTAKQGKLVNADKFDRQEARNVASYYLLMLRSTRQNQYSQYADANHSVLKLLRREFRL
jgi:hypothetical protein